MIEGVESNGWLEPLEPPPGGLASLRQRLARRERRRRHMRRSAAGGVVAMFAIAAALVWTGSSEPAALLPVSDDLLAIHLGLAEVQTEPAAIAPAKRHSAALLRVPTNDARVVFYLVGDLGTHGGES